MEFEIKDNQPQDVKGKVYNIKVCINRYGFTYCISLISQQGMEWDGMDGWMGWDGMDGL